MLRLDIWIRKDQKQALEKLSEQTGASVAWIVRKAIDEFLKKEANR